jgi:hypothetical protein
MENRTPTGEPGPAGCSFYTEIPVRSLHAPAHERDAAAGDFNAGYTIRMDTAARIEIGGSVFSEIFGCGCGRR